MTADPQTLATTAELLVILKALSVVLIGAVFGIISQYVLTMVITNGEFKRISARRLKGMRLLGGLAAFSAGIAYFAAASPEQAIADTFKIWSAQIGAGMGASELYRKYKKDPKKANEETEPS